MREYLIYSVLVFIPVAAAMYFLLRRELTSNRDIAIIIGLAFLIIVNFPFIIQKLGWIKAVIVYLLILYGLILYLVKRIEVGDACSGDQKEGRPDKEYISAEKQLEAEPIEADAFPGGEKEAGWLASELSAASEATPDETTEYDEYASDCLGSSNQAVETGLSAEKVNDATQTEPPVQPSTISININNNEDEDICLLKTEEGEGRSEETERNEPAEAENSVHQPQLQEINALIEEAFVYKSQNHYSLAVQCLNKVLNLTNEAELKYMALKEQIYLLKQLGQYNEAIDLVQSFVNHSWPEADIMNDIQNELEYLVRLKNELDYLKIGNLPIAQVPRWIKLKLGS